MKNRFLWPAIIILILASCTDGIYKQLGRPLADPVIVQPEVITFSQEKTVVITWKADVCADEYILYRRHDADGAANNILYQGTALKYLDADGEFEERYLYSLSKIRGRQEFGPSEEVLGVFSNTIRDFSEPNDAKTQAAWLESDLEANIFYYRDRSGHILQDEDWYYVDVPPRRIAHLLVNQDGLDIGDTFCYFSQEGGIPFQAVNNTDIQVENYAHSTQRLYFKLYPVPGEFLNDISQAGGSVVGYTLTLDTITSL